MSGIYTDSMYSRLDMIKKNKNSAHFQLLLSPRSKDLPIFTAFYLRLVIWCNKLTFLPWLVCNKALHPGIYPTTDYHGLYW